MKLEAPFEENDLKTLALANRTLYRQDPNAARRFMDNLIGLSTLPSSSPEVRFLRCIQFLRQNIQNTSATQKLEGIYQPFWNLGADQRLALGLLHGSKVSWARINQCLELSTEQSKNLEMFLWSARQELVYRQSVGEPVPAGPSHPGISCPPFDPSMPWAQKFFDQEFSASERVFIEKHLLECKSCAEHLQRFRVFYYKAEKAVFDALEPSSIVSPRLEFLNPHPAKEAAMDLLGRRDIWIAIAGFLIVVTIGRSCAQ